MWLVHLAYSFSMLRDSSAPRSQQWKSQPLWPSELSLLLAADSHLEDWRQSLLVRYFDRRPSSRKNAVFWLCTSLCWWTVGARNGVALLAELSLWQLVSRGRVLPRELTVCVLLHRKWNLLSGHARFTVHQQEGKQEPDSVNAKLLGRHGSPS